MFRMPLQSPGSLVALWVTNRPRIARLASERLLPAWGLTRVATWWWLKVTSAGEPVTPLHDGASAAEASARHPFEQLWLCRCAAAPATECGGGISEQAAAGAQQLAQPPDGYVVASVPARHHSRKPHLGRLLAPYVECAVPRRLELFARELFAGWTSWGNEVLLFQQAALFAEQPAAARRAAAAEAAPAVEGFFPSTRRAATDVSV